MAPKRKKTDKEKAFLKNRVHGSVICKLSRVCKYEPIVDEIQRSARELKQCQLEAWHVANVHVLRCLDEKLPLPSFDKTFFNRCCAGVMKEAEDMDREKRAQPPSTSKPRKQQRTMARQSVAATEEEEEVRDDNQRKNARAQVEDAELISTFRLFWEQRASNPAYEPPSLEFSAAIRGELAKAQMVNTINMISLQFRRRLHQYIRFRYAKEDEIQLDLKDTKRLVESCYRVKEIPVPCDDIESSTPAAKKQKKPKKPKMQKLWDEWDDTEDPTERELRAWLGMVPWDWNIKKNLAHFVPKLHDMLTWMEKFAEKHPKTKGVRLYSLLPYSSSYASCYITVNGSTLHGICARIFKRTGWKLDSVPLAPLGGLALQPFFHGNRSRLLREIFSVTQFETRVADCTVPRAAFDAMDHEEKMPYASRYFADQVSSNGYGVSVLLTHPKDASEISEKAATDKTLLDDRDPFVIARRRLPLGYFPDVMIGIDPGMRTLCTAVSVGRLPRRRVRRKWLQLRNKRKRRRLNRQYRRGQKIIEISTREYRHMSKMNHFRAWNERLKKREPWYAGVSRAMPSFKTASYTTYTEGLWFFFMHVRFLLAFTAENPFLKWRFTRERLKAKALDALAKRLVPVPSPQVCIAYGDWSRRDGIKGHDSGPVKGFAKALKKRATVLPMDEFRTSITCSCCHKRMKETPLLTKVRKPKDGEEEARKKKVVKKKPKLSAKDLKEKAKREALETKETERMKNPKLADWKIVLKSNRNVLRCTNSRCEANFWNRDVNAARNMLELMKGYFQNFGRATAFMRGGQ